MNFTGAMKWKVSEPIKPIAGQSRSVTRFAWWPIRIGGAMYWLEQYQELYVWETHEVVAADRSMQFQAGRWTLVSIKPTTWIPA